jgi:hypothetical protein
MSLERKDVRLKLDHDKHAAAKVIAETEGKDIAEWIEEVIVDVIKKRVHLANVIVSRLEETGAIGTFRDESGK